jgi:prepilin-type N-terminal cleavage/methylation domain-containing protein/prepilin-type processing-associated H-X9-DG protein
VKTKMLKCERAGRLINGRNFPLPPNAIGLERGCVQSTSRSTWKGSEASSIFQEAGFAKLLRLVFDTAALREQCADAPLINWRVTERAGFTLTELLVVIGVIALLAATLLPALAGTKIGTKNIQCLNNLRQLTSEALAYQSDNGAIGWTSVSTLWMTSLKSNQGSSAIRLCPFAMNPVNGAIPNAQGTANNAWTWDVLSNPNNPNSPLVATNGSYAINGWLYKYHASMSSFIDSSEVNSFFPTVSAIKHPSQTPEFVDALWPDLWPNQMGSLDGNNGAWNLYDDFGRCSAVTTGSQNQGMARCCIARHSGSGPIGSTMKVAGNKRPLWNGGVNISCADGHVEPTTLEGLWSYYWNMTVAPGTRPIM